jgi:serine/threonine protein kinase
LLFSDRFELLDKLGEGSFSEIYKANDKKDKRIVALKVEKIDKKK